MPNKSADGGDLVSVIIPFFDGEDFLAEAIESVLAETYRDWELTLVDEGSTDGGPRRQQRSL